MRTNSIYHSGRGITTMWIIVNGRKFLLRGTFAEVFGALKAMCPGGMLREAAGGGR